MAPSSVGWAAVEQAPRGSSANPAAHLRRTPLVSSRDSNPYDGDGGGDAAAAKEHDRE
jgi:hypothetical protein